MANDISSTENDPIISIRDVIRTFGSGDSAVTAVNKISCDVNQSEFLSITGRSGSGKTTLLNLMAGLDKPTSGSVKMNGLEIGDLSESDLVELRRNSLGFVFQSFGLLPLLSAFENVELPLRISGTPAKKRENRAREMLEMVGLSNRLHHRPYELSGGEQQRVAIARAVVSEPLLILADEPTGELDSVNAKTIFGLFKEMVQEHQISVVATTHDPTLLGMADQVLEMSDGKLLEETNLIGRYND